ncbi:hypothetical protein CEXT_68071 [Caerostris extrusa]|uniref:Uncharacterized protein n=1 Tax=Caerostris extrusa TaxID=172846 RepID=A0AAV4USC4_CAEEX|nr:hypothetical protein CEXT_68071 [Caerostris extrusa]
MTTPGIDMQTIQGGLLQFEQETMSGSTAKSIYRLDSSSDHGGGMDGTSSRYQLIMHSKLRCYNFTQLIPKSPTCGSVSWGFENVINAGTINIGGAYAGWELHASTPTMEPPSYRFSSIFGQHRRHRLIEDPVRGVKIRGGPSYEKLSGGHGKRK